MLRRLRRVPLPLGLLLVVATIQALAWIVLLPPIQGPDENSHFSYVQRIWEDHTIPWSPGGGTPGPHGSYSQELYSALNAGGFGPLLGNVGARPLWTRADERAWTVAARGTDRANGSYSSTLRNPPVYYLYEAIPYGVSSGGTIWDRLILTRLGNVPLFLIALLFVWLLAGELLGRGPLQYLATASAAFVPQLLNVVATVNPDIALVAECSAGLYLMTLVVRRGPRLRYVVPLALALIAAGLTQPRGLSVVVPAVMAVLLAFARERGWRRVNPLTVGVGALVTAAPVALVLATRGTGSARQFASYVWQFYLPKLGFMNPTIGPQGYDLHTAFVARIFGTLAQLEVVLPPTLDDIAWWVARLGLMALVIALFVRRDSLRANAGVAVVLFTAIWTLVLGLHLVAYRAMLTDPGDPVITGRYLLPLVGLLGIAIAIVASALPRLWRAGYSGVVLAAGVALQLISLGLLLERFYA